MSASDRRILQRHKHSPKSRMEAAQAGLGPTGKSKATSIIETKTEKAGSQENQARRHRAATDVLSIERH